MTHYCIVKQGRWGPTMYAGYITDDLEDATRILSHVDMTTTQQTMSIMRLEPVITKVPRGDK